MPIDTNRLIRVGQAKCKDRAAWEEGISLERVSGQSIRALQVRVATARILLAKEMHSYSKLAMKLPKPLYRLAINRAYYSMYHAIRAAAYLHYGGDDHQQHSDLPQKLPGDFPDHQKWGNQLKSAREYRNQADYDPYPRSHVYWKGVAVLVTKDANELAPLTANYLRAKGCRL